MAWYDFYKLFTYAFTQGPLDRKKDTKQLTGAGTTQPDVLPDLRNADGYSAGANAFIRIQNDLVDLTTTTNRANRYKEYDRLVASVPEIEMAMTVFADEACVAGETEIATVFHGYQRIDYLARHKADERFPVYCYNFDTQDYTIGWAFAPRFVKRAPTVRLCLDNGEYEVVTADHRILTREGRWVMAGSLKFGDELMPFYRLPANPRHSKIRSNQFPRIWTHNNGWVHERQFIDEWRLGRKLKQYENTNKVIRWIGEGLTLREIAKYNHHDWVTVDGWLKKEGFTYNEIRHLMKHNPDRRRIIGVMPGPEIDVYDLSVEGHENFCTRSLVMHNCQKNEDGHVFKIECSNDEVVDELKFLFFHRSMLNFDQRNCWDKSKRLFIKGDAFWELVINPDNPKEGIYKIQDLPPESMYRIETTKGKLLEFQQGKEGPDYQALQRAPITSATESELAQATAVRFAPEQIIHLRIGDYRKTFYPYGVSLIEAARGPAHQLRMMEDAMVVYRLTRAPERRVFYIDVGQLPPFKAEAFMERMKDQFRKKKVVSGRGNTGAGASAVEERWHAPAQDEDFWIPIRPNSNTRIDTLPGAENLGEIDDTVYFRNKLFTALNFPKNYFSLEDPNATRITLSAQDVKFARMIERLQSHIEDALWEIADRHLRLRGYPPEAYDDLIIKMTPPSDWRELSRAEVVTNRINNANGLKGSQLMSDFDILTKWMKYTEDEANEMISRLKIQKLEDLKLQVLAQNPQLLGVGIPGQGETEMGAEPDGPNPMLGPDQGMPPGGMPPSGGPPPEGGGMPPMGGAPVPGGPPMPPPPQGGAGMMPPAGQGQPIPEPTEEEIIKYDMEIQDYEAEQDEEDIDYSEVE
jgi:hypothetical protein